ncbi:hypothetical protein CFE70_008626 [Pyrenophora teres f. teres 0-1]
MSSVQFTALIRFPFIRGDFEDPPQAQWDAERDRQLWKVISKTSKTSDLDWVDLADKFQVPPTFLLQQAAWLYERHLDHVRNQMKRVSISNANPSPSPTGGSTLAAMGGVAMRRGGSAGSGGLLQLWLDVRGTALVCEVLRLRCLVSTLERMICAFYAPDLLTHLSPLTLKDTVNNYDHAVPGAGSSTYSEFRPPRFQQKRTRDLATFEEGDGTQEIDDSGSHETSLPFASAARTQPGSSKYPQETQFRTSSRTEQTVPQNDTRKAPPSRQTSLDVHSLATTEAASSMTSSGGPPSAAKSPMSPVSNHRAELGRLGSPRHAGLRGRKEGSEGTPSMGSSFSDIDAHYWACASVLLDYFSDFFWRDTAHMQAVWFHLLDIWQENAKWLPWESIIEEEKARLKIERERGMLMGMGSMRSVLERARTFEKHIRETIDLIQIVAWGVRGKPSPGPGPDAHMVMKEQDVQRGNKRGAMGFDLVDRVIYDPKGEAWCPAGDYETGPWVSGLKPWLQFLGIGGPGVAVSTAVRRNNHHNNNNTVKAAGDAGPANEDQDKEITLTRYIPQPAIAILKSHTKRTTTMASRLDARLPDRRLAFQVGIEDNSLSFPEVWKEEQHTYVSQLTGCKTTYSLRNGVPPIVRHRGWGDVSMSVKKPDLVLLDECVALSRRVGVYEPVGRAPENDDDDDDDDDDEEEDGDEDGDEDGEEESEVEDVFDMWTVVESIVRAESGETGSRGGNESDQLLDLGPMFDHWCAIDEVEEF